MKFQQLDEVFEQQKEDNIQNVFKYNCWYALAAILNEVTFIQFFPKVVESKGYLQAEFGGVIFRSLWSFIYILSIF